MSKTSKSGGRSMRDGVLERGGPIFFEAYDENFYEAITELPKAE